MMRTARSIAALLAISLAVAAAIACSASDEASSPVASDDAPAPAASDDTPPIPAPGLVSELAPIESVDIEVREIDPPQYVAVVKSGLPNACYELGGYSVSREGQIVRIEMTNTRQTGPDLACAEIYRTIETRVDLGSDFTSPEPYTVDVNGVTTTLVAQRSSPPPPSESILEPAPIQSVDIEVREIDPPQYVAVVKSGLPNACYELGGYGVSREGQIVRIEMTNTRQTGPDLACAEIYRTIETRVDLGSDFTSTEPYTVDVNGVTTTLVAQRSSAPAPSERVSEPAPVLSVTIEVREIDPPQYVAVVTSGQRNSCVLFGDYTVAREGQRVKIEVSNTRPAATDVVCAQVYGTTETRIDLGSDFMSAEPYTVDVNGVTATIAPRAAVGPASGDAPVSANLGEPFTLGLGQKASLEPAGLDVEFDTVAEDSRCAVDVTCIWAGRARVTVVVTADDGDTANMMLILGGDGPGPATGSLGELSVTLQALDPYPGTVKGEPVYQATLVVTERPASEPSQTAPEPAKDASQVAPGYRKAPIESTDILVLESYPVQYVLAVTSGLPNGCTRFDRYELSRLDDTSFRVEIINSVPTDPGRICTQVYGIVETSVPLGTDFESGTTYTVSVNGVVETFKPESTEGHRWTA